MHTRRVVRGALAGALVLAAAIPVLVLAQAGGTPPAGGEGYPGVVPGTGNLPPRADAARRSQARLLTWPGFQARPDGVSRVFVQTSTAVAHTTSSERGRFVLLLQNTGVHLRNNRRPLETRYFNSPVSRIVVEPRGRNLAIVIELRGEATPRVYTEAGQNGFHFVFAEFPAGNWAPTPDSGGASEAEAPPAP